MSDAFSRIKWTQLRHQLSRPWHAALGINTFHYSHVIDRANRNRAEIAAHNRASNNERVAATAASSAPPASLATQQPQKIAVETWKGEGGTTRLQSPRAE